MENLTYQAYLANPAIRARLERDARRMRSEEIRRCIALPLALMFKKLFKRAPQQSAQPRHALA